MKLVIQSSGGVTVRHVPEFDASKVISEVKSKYLGQIIEPLSHEIFRYKIRDGVIFLTKTSRRNKMRNHWFEVRALAALSRIANESFRLGKSLTVDGFHTEIDGIGTKSGTPVEATTATVTRNWMNFYEKKRKKLNADSMIVVAHDISDNVECRDNIRLYKMHIDWQSIRRYYRDFEFLPWFQNIVPRRHFRFLYGNGRWKGIRRSITPTAKHTLESKFLLELQKRNKDSLPIKIYYSQSAMINPVREHNGKGYPLPQIAMVFDIDSDTHPHIVGKDGYCLQCIDEARIKRNLAETCLTDLGYSCKSVLSGTKGFHLYCMDDFGVLEVKIKEYQNVLNQLSSLTDSKTFVDSKGQFDTHRIMKVPNTIDCESGLIIEEFPTRIAKHDRLVLYE